MMKVEIGQKNTAELQPTPSLAKESGQKAPKIQDLFCSLKEKHDFLQKLENKGFAVTELKTRTEQALNELQSIMQQLEGTI